METRSCYGRREITAQTFSRKVRLAEAVHPDDVRANLEASIFEIVLPMNDPKETKKVTIT